MIELIRLAASEYFFYVLEYLKKNPKSNASKIAKQLKVHIITVQKILDGLTKHGFVEYEWKGGIGRPSKLYSYIGGSFEINIDALLSEFSDRYMKIKERVGHDIRFNLDVDKGVVNALILDKRGKNKIILDKREGEFLNLLPTPDEDYLEINFMAGKSGMPVLEAIEFVKSLEEINLIDIEKKELEEK
jgi:predicted transcriptional regulator